MRKVTCKQVILDFLADYLDETLRLDIVAELERHLQDCEPCVAYLKTYEETKDLMRRGVPVEMPEQMRTRLRGFLLEHLARGIP